MPRKPRLYMPNIPCHVIQRGNNRNACFYSDEDFQFYLDHLAKACKRFDVSLHAYVLMTNHTHLLMTPLDEQGISRVMQSLGRCYVQYINKTYRRSGTLWEGRHKSSLVDVESYLLACYRYIELNPVRARMVEQPEDYRWSSYRVNALGEESDIVSFHPVYQALAGSDEKRLEMYRCFFSGQADQKEINTIRQCLTSSMPVGSSRFKAEIESALGRRIGFNQRGRPRNKKLE